MALAAGARLGPYEVLGLIGAADMGEVYKAKDTRLDRTVAIKVRVLDRQCGRWNSKMTLGKSSGARSATKTSTTLRC